MAKTSEDQLARDILTKAKELEDLRLPWESLWQDVADYVVPRRFDIKGTAEKGQQTGTSIYDGSPMGALQLMADGFHGYLISPNMQWFRLTLKKQGLDRVPEVKSWLQEVEEEMYFAFQQSNFYDCMSEYFLDGGSIGTATMIIEEEVNQGGRINFLCMHPGEVYIAENHFKRVDTVFRKFELTARQALQKFGDGGNLSDKLIRDAKKPGTANTTYQFWHAVFPREDRDVTMSDSKNMPYASVYVELSGSGTSSEKGTTAREMGYRSFPYPVWRFRKNSNETYGRSPAGDALVEIKKLNEIGKTMLRAAQLSVEPPYNVPSEMKGAVNIKPRGFNYYEDPNRVVTPLMQRIDFPFGIDREERSRQIIEEHFRVDFFLMLARAEKQMTATEILERQGEKAAVLGATIGRLNNECLNPVIDRVFELLMNSGRLPEPPGILLEYSGQNIDVEYLGPLAQAQRRLFRTQGISAALEQATPVLQLQQTLTGRADAADLIDFDETLREILDANGAPQKIILTEERLKALREAKAQAQEEAQQKQDMMGGIEGLKGLAQADQASGGKLSGAMQGAMGQEGQGLVQ